MNDIPNKRRNRFPCPRTVKLSRESDELIEKLQSMGKEPADFMRMCVERGLSEVFPERAQLSSAKAAKVG